MTGYRDKVELPASKKHARDRVYVWTQTDGTHDMYWMQDASEAVESGMLALRYYAPMSELYAPFISSLTLRPGYLNEGPSSPAARSER